MLGIYYIGCFIKRALNFYKKSQKFDASLKKEFE